MGGGAWRQSTWPYKAAAMSAAEPGPELGPGPDAGGGAVPRTGGGGGAGSLSLASESPRRFGGGAGAHSPWMTCAA